MNRLAGAGFAELINFASSCIPGRLKEYARSDVLAGADPVFVDLHHYGLAIDGRPYANTMHVAYQHQQQHRPRDQRVTTIVIPKRTDEWWAVVHEMGHVVHERLEWEPNPDPVTEWAKTNRYEAFAEAFTAWCLLGYGDRPVDLRTRTLLEGLARWP